MAEAVASVSLGLTGGVLQKRKAEVQACSRARPSRVMMMVASSSSSSSSSACSLFRSQKLSISHEKCLQRRHSCASRGNRKPLGLQVRAAVTFMPSSAKWWEKGITSNMKEVNSAQELAETLLITGDQLVVVNYFSPGCGACRSVHPKICQLAEKNPDVQFVKVNYEENKSMCYSLHIHVLPFFQFFRGAHGRLCSFSCTVGTIKKFKDALAKHNTPRCSLGPPVGFGEAELKALSENKSLSFTMPKVPVTTEKKKEPMPAWLEKLDEMTNGSGAATSRREEDQLALVGARR